MSQRLYTVLLVLCVGAASVHGYIYQMYNDPNRIRPKPTYVILAPRVVRAGETVNIHVSVYDSPFAPLTVHASIRRQGHEIGSTRNLFHKGSSNLMQIKMPEYAERGNYTMRVWATPGTVDVTTIFDNETEIVFNPKQVSVFIQFDRPFYNKRTTLNFRVIALHPNLLPVEHGSINVFVKEPTGRIVRRWHGEQLLNGVYENGFAFGHPIRYGWWTVEVQGWGHTYNSTFYNKNYYPAIYDTNTTLPSYVMDNEFAFAGVADIRHKTRMPMKGNMTVRLEIRPPNTQLDQYPVIEKKYGYFEGHMSFLFPMREIAEHTPKLAGTKLIVHTEVHEYITGWTRTLPQYSEIYSSDVKVTFIGGTVRTFKPGVPFTVQVAVYHPDGSRFSRTVSRQVYVHVTIRNRNGGQTVAEEIPKIIPSDSIIHHKIVPGDTAEMVTVRVRYSGSGAGYQELTAYRYYTPTDRYIDVSTSTTKPKVDHYMVFTVRSNVYLPQITYVVVAKSGIVTSGLIFMKSRQKTFSLALSRDMVPFARILVYAVYDDGEVLSDALNFYVAGIRTDGVKLEMNHGQDFSRDTLNIVAHADPGAYIAFSSMEQEMWAHGANREQDANLYFTKYAVEKELESYEMGGNVSFSFTWLKDSGRKEVDYFHAPSTAIDSNQTFSFAGLNIFTDAYVPRLPAAYTCNSTLGFLPCFDGNCYLVEQSCDGVRHCADGVDELGCPTTLDYSRPDYVWMNYIYQRQIYTNTQFAWINGYTKPYGRVDFTIPLPIRAVRWVLGAFTLSQEDGLAFTEEPARFSSERPFYFTIQSESVARKGEQLGLILTMFNTWSDHIEVLVTLHGSDDYVFVNVEDGGWASSYAPRTTAGDVQTMVYMPKGKIRWFHMPVLPLRTGDVVITITMVTHIRSQTSSHKVSISMDGVENFYHTPYYIDLVNKGSQMIPSMEIPIWERFQDPELPYFLYVPGSASASVSVVGDVLGPGFVSPHLQFKHVFNGQIRGSSGDTFIFEYAANLYWLQFLKTTNQLSRDTLDNALEGMTRDLMEMYAYISEEGGFTLRQAFRGGPPSVWMTGLALEVLADSYEPEWEDRLFIDITVLNQMALWLTDQQDVATGAFPQSENNIYHRFDSVLKSPEGVPLNLSITAMAAIGLAKAVPVITGEATSRADSASAMAAEHLARYFDLITDPFLLCLVTYALHVTGHRNKDNAFSKMVAAARTGEFIYWSREEIPPLDTKIINAIPYLSPKGLPLPWESEAVQATSYALMVYLLHNQFEETTPILTWLQNQRNTDSSFDAHLDTLVALQAIKEYGEHVNNRQIYDMLVHLECSSDSTWRHDIHLERGNFLQYYKTSISKAYGVVNSAVTGTGLGLLQLTSKENVEFPFLMRQPAFHSFDLWVENLRFDGYNGSAMHMTVCTRWVATELAAQSGACNLEVDIPSGYHIQKEQLRLGSLGPISGKRPRFTGHRVIVSFDAIDTRTTCFYISGQRWYPVANVSIQHKMRIYDLSEPGLQNNTLYRAFTPHHLHICQVCGSFQCPYCPFYNTAPSFFSAPSLLLSLLTLVITILTLNLNLPITTTHR